MTMRRLLTATLAATLLTAAPLQAAQAKDFLYLNGLSNMWVVDSDTLQVVQTVPTKGLSQCITLNEDATRLYIVTGQRELIQVVDRATGKIVETFSFSQPGRSRARIYGVAVIKDRLYAYITASRFDGWEDGKQDRFHLAEPEIVAVDLATKKKLARLPMPLGILDLQPVEGGKRLYAMGRNIYDIDAATLKVRRMIPLDPPAMTGEGQILINAEWVHPESASGMGAFPYYTTDPITQRLTTGLLTMDDRDGAVDHFEIGPPVANNFGFAAAVSPDRKRAYVTMNKFFEVDLVKRRVSRVRDFGKSYYSVTTSEDGKRIYLSSSGATLTELDAETLTVRRTLEMPGEVWDITALPTKGGPAAVETKTP
jgi:DNA-binding beta-propeller fold protein YncE